MDTKLKVAFLTEMSFHGKIPADHTNMRTEFAWMHALEADHFNVLDFNNVKGYDWVLLVLPKGGVSLNSEGIRLNDNPNRYAELYASNFVEILKQNNTKTAYVQEGPAWYVNDFSLPNQFHFYNRLAECDVIFAHNEYDTNWYKGWFPSKKITTIPTLMIETLIRDISHNPENKAIIGGNFCHWYGGFQSYIVANLLECPLFVQTSHCSQPGEDMVPNLNILPRLVWEDWIKALATFKYAIHLMPTIAAGTFNLNCAYLGIPCIGNIKVDTQRICFPELSIESENVSEAEALVTRLKLDHDFYTNCSQQAQLLYKKHYGLDIWQEKMYGFMKDNL